jgi:hypothetical protein
MKDRKPNSLRRFEIREFSRSPALRLQMLGAPPLLQMIATYPPTRTARPLAIAPAVLACVLILPPAFLKVHLDRPNQTEELAASQATRQDLLSAIEEAATRGDVDALLAIQHKYASRFSDRTLKRTLSDAIGASTARATHIKLSASRSLDLARCREQASRRPLSPRPLHTVEKSRLSILPR